MQSRHRRRRERLGDLSRRTLLQERAEVRSHRVVEGQAVPFLLVLRLLLPLQHEGVRPLLQPQHERVRLPQQGLLGLVGPRDGRLQDQLLPASLPLLIALQKRALLRLLQHVPQPLVRLEGVLLPQQGLLGLVGLRDARLQVQLLLAAWLGPVQLLSLIHI